MGFGYLDVRHFEIFGKPGAPSGLKAKEGNVYVRFSTFALFKSPLLAFRDARLTLGKVEVENLVFRDLLLDISKAGRNSLSIDRAGASMFGGKVLSSGVVAFDDKAWKMDLKAHLKDIEVAELLKAFRMEKRVEGSGVYEGSLRVSLKGSRIEDLTGELNSRNGGKFIITDTSLLSADLLKKGAANIVVENLKNYHYDIGSIKIRNVGQDIKIGVFLEGQMGERNLDIMWYRQEGEKK